MRVSSSIAIAYDTVSAPAPPYSSAIGIPISPSSAISCDELVREALLAVELLGDRCDLRLGELAHRAAQQLLLFGQLIVHAKLDASSAIRRTPYPVPPGTR